MNKINIPNKEELERAYLVDNLTKEELSSKYNVSLNTIHRWLKGFSIKKPRKLVTQAQKRIVFEKYGVNNVSKVPQFREKAEQTMLKKYGVSNASYSRELRNKAENTMLKKYGVKNPSQSKELSQKKVETCRHNFGVDFPMQSNVVRNKSINTCMDKYGVDHVSKCKDIIKKSQSTCLSRYGVPVFAKSDLYKDIRRKTCLEKYDTDFPSQARISKESFNILNSKEDLNRVILSLHSKTYRQVAETLDISERTAAKYIRIHKLDSIMDPTISTQEQDIKEIFSELNLVKNRDVLDGREIDLYSKEHKIGIEFNGNYWHCDIFRDKNYHKDKSLLAENKGIFLFHIFEYEWNNQKTKNAIINRLKNLFMENKEKIFARKCIIKEVSSKEARLFLDTNHVQGYAPSQIRLGLYYNNELVSLMEFITYGLNRKYQYELSRFCTKMGYNVVGGASKLFKHFIRTYNPKSIISYSDIAKTTGKIYDTLGFKLDSVTKPQYHWVNSSITYSRYQTQLKELRKKGWLLPNEKKSESQVMQEHGFSKLYDCGKKVWVWK